MTKPISIIIGGDFSVSGCPVPETPLWDDALASIMEQIDLRGVNLEGPLTRSERRRPKIGVALKGAPAFAAFLAKNKVNMVSLANNHIFDYEEKGVEDTLDLCNESGIIHAGIVNRSKDSSVPVKYVDVGGRCLGFYCLAEHEFNYKDDFSLSTVLLEPARNVLEIQKARRECDALIVFSHIGPEHTAYPSPRMVSLFRCFAEAGASAIVNAHAHHVMGMEVYQGVPIFYGLGNLLFSMENRMAGWTEGLLARLDWHEAGGLKGTPVFTSFDAKRMQVSLDERPSRVEEFRQISETIGNPQALDAEWHRFCASQRHHILKECLKGQFAMLPLALRAKCSGKFPKVAPSSYFAKGARMLRGMFQCENHADVLARIFRDFANGD